MITQGKNGFSLLETIIVIAMVGILASIVITLLGRQVSLSPRQILWSRNEVSSQTIMESIVADYVQLMNVDATRATALSTLKSNNASNKYAPQGVVVMKNIGFNRTGGPEQPGSDLLKVTVQKPGGISLTTILSTSRTEDADTAVNY